MKYAVSCMMRFDTVEGRDRVADFLLHNMVSRYKGDDAHVQRHKCYHDEDPPKSCEVEDTVVCFVASP